MPNTPKISDLGAQRRIHTTDSHQMILERPRLTFGTTVTQEGATLSEFSLDVPQLPEMIMALHALRYPAPHTNIDKP